MSAGLLKRPAPWSFYILWGLVWDSSRKRTGFRHSERSLRSEQSRRMLASITNVGFREGLVSGEYLHANTKRFDRWDAWQGVTKPGLCKPGARLFLACSAPQPFITQLLRVSSLRRLRSE